MPKLSAIPITSPVERISGPSTGSTPGNLTKGKTGSLMKKLVTVSSSGRLNSDSVRPVITRAAILASGTPVAFDTKGTVREARGLTSST